MLSGRRVRSPHWTTETCDTAALAHAQGLKNVFVTNGYMSAEALERVSPWLDAANVDLKAFDDTFYKRQCGARLEPVKATLRRMKSLNIWVEVTTLIIPGLNDDPAALSRLAAFIADDLGKETPWHVSRFHPTYRLTDRPATPVETLIRAREIGLEAGLKYVYTGNIPGQGGEDTLCPGCGEAVIVRRGFHIATHRLGKGRCGGCGTPIEGVGM